MTLRILLDTECRRERRHFGYASLLAATVGSTSVLLLGLSGWFITGAALAGLAGPGSVLVFNYLLPSAGVRLLAILRTGARYGERLSSHAAALRAMARVRGLLFLGIARSPAALATGAGEAASRMVQDIAVLEGALVRRSTRWTLAASVTSGTALLMLGGWRGVAWTLTCLGLLLIASTIVARRSDNTGHEVQTCAGLLRQEFAELASARAELHCYGLEEWAADRIAKRSGDFGKAQQRLTADSGQYEALQVMLLALAATGACALAAPAGPTIAALAALAAAMTIDGTAPFVRHIGARGLVRAAERRLDALIASDADVPASRIVPPTLSLGRSMRIGIAGPSGCGKTTLVEQLIGLLALPRGFIYLCGEDLADRPDRRALFAWCPQDAMLPTGTVRDVMNMAAPQADSAALWSALHDAAIDDRIRLLGGLDVWIGEDGVRLSGGERRRLAVARALLIDTPWLLLDEPTEGLDAQTEMLLMARVDARLRRTRQGLLLVSHRPCPLRFCDSIVTLNTIAATDLAA